MGFGEFGNFDFGILDFGILDFGFSTFSKSENKLICLALGVIGVPWVGETMHGVSPCPPKLDCKVQSAAVLGEEAGSRNWQKFASSSKVRSSDPRSRRYTTHMRTKVATTRTMMQCSKVRKDIRLRNQQATCLSPVTTPKLGITSNMR